MLEIVAEPSSFCCSPAAPGPRVQEYQRLGPDLGLEPRADREFVILFSDGRSSGRIMRNLLSLTHVSQSSA
jgi:hypothetical protein